jgi:hypothetical protein
MGQPRTAPPEEKKPLRSLLVGFSLVTAVLFLLFLSRAALLAGLADYFAPSRDARADAAILEGTELLTWGLLKTGLDLVASGKAGRLVIVIQQAPAGSGNVGLSDYPSLLTGHLEKMGSLEGRFQVVAVPMSHPITLTEAGLVLSALSSKGAGSAIVVAEGFHTRRSYWSYKTAGLRRGIEISPHPCFVAYPKEGWWTHLDGLHEMVDESLKLLYYVLKGYLPFKSLISI